MMDGRMGMQPGMPFAMSSLGDHLMVIAEPGINERGKPRVPGLAGLLPRRRRIPQDGSWFSPVHRQTDWHRA